MQSEQILHSRHSRVSSVWRDFPRWCVISLPETPNNTGRFIMAASPPCKGAAASAPLIGRLRVRSTAPRLSGILWRRETASLRPPWQGGPRRGWGGGGPEDDLIPRGSDRHLEAALVFGCRWRRDAEAVTRWVDANGCALDGMRSPPSAAAMGLDAQHVLRLFYIYR